MGGILSLSNPDSPTIELNEVSQSEMCKRQKISVNVWEDIPQLIIPGLPDEISIQILARLPRNYYLNAKLVCRGWKAAVTSPELYKVRKELGTTEEWLYVLTKGSGDKLLWHGLDPVSRKWQRLPPVPSLTANDGSRRGLSALRLWSMVSSTMRIAGAIRGWLGKKGSLDQIPFCGCAIGAVNGCLYVLGGFCKASTMRCVWRYDPITNAWNEVSPMCVGRAYCKTGVLNGKLYVVGGVTRDRDQGGLTPLQSAEVFDPETGIWVEVPSMPFTKAHMLPTAFLADFLKPIATGISSYRGKLYVPQSLYCWPFFVDAGGEVYDPETNAWVEMPMGMGEGWPARQAGTKLSVIVDGELYALDPSSSFDSAKIKVYDSRDDSWKAIEGDIPIRDLTDSESPYLLAGLLGKLNVIAKDANQNILVLQADRQHNQNENEKESDANIWRVIASRNSGSAELISCQILDM
ncbi:PREDICTED: F-box/kelch-repeat protein At1g22040-like [Ipomoea nil]|uniref:F-box/kelch-repeat protein At1g22040-like n=1 Tax=Ipomoea nil TaxID=35883 RepID=UPI000900B140|nr:PREDICTED: F-box/kelch-repeat protein At1g22040-like [Ipomoea nil]XP_019173484.1 PREDICTED: F-box/kelch-repeat protein At1g22040-like [Ipomoea nil]